jgi:hypothetical protein
MHKNIIVFYHQVGIQIQGIRDQTFPCVQRNNGGKIHFSASCKIFQKNKKQYVLTFLTPRLYFYQNLSLAEPFLGPSSEFELKLNITLNTPLAF